MRVKKLFGEFHCQWHGPGAETMDEQRLFPGGCCPWLYHSLYPYFLGILYGAKFDYNEQGDCHVGCPAAKGIDAVVMKRANDGTFDPRIGPDMGFVIFAEVVGRHGDCPYGNEVGQRIIFPTSMSHHYSCPAAFNNLFPLLGLEPPSCIDRSRMRCPDWDNPIEFSVVAE